MRVRTRGLPLQLVILCSLLMTPLSTLSTAQPAVASAAAGSAQSTSAAPTMAPARATMPGAPRPGQHTSVRGRAAIAVNPNASTWHGLGTAQRTSGTTDGTRHAAHPLGAGWPRFTAATASARPILAQALGVSLSGPGAPTTASAQSSPPPDPSQCSWVQDCGFATFQPGASGIWSPNKGGDGNVYLDGSALALPNTSGVQQNTNFGPYDPNSTYAYTLTFSARSVPAGDQDAQLYVGFRPTDCSYNWFRLYASQGWQQLTVTGWSNPNVSPSSGSNPPGADDGQGPPPVVCFLNEYAVPCGTYL
jgi:hypothetical protein